MTMVCDNCGRVGIKWKGPLSNLTHTECPHCGGTNCQRESLGWDEDGMCDDHGKTACRACAIQQSEKAKTMTVELTRRDEAIAVLEKWQRDTPIYTGDQPKALHYQRSHRALETALEALRSPATPAASEEMSYSERLEYEERILAAEMATIQATRETNELRELARADKDRRIEIAAKIAAARFPPFVALSGEGMAGIINAMEDFAQACTLRPTAEASGDAVERARRLLEWFFIVNGVVAHKHAWDNRQLADAILDALSETRADGEGK